MRGEAQATMVQIWLSICNPVLWPYLRPKPLQGTEDKVVPMSQAVGMYDQLKAKGLVTALVLFEGEQHGFRGTSAIRYCTLP